MWDERYAEDGYAYGRDPNEYLAQRAGEIPAGGEVLCLAEGEGRNAVWLAGQGYRVTAMDGSKVGLEKAASLAREAGVAVAFEHGDLADYPIGEARWDGIVLIWAPIPRELRRRVFEASLRGLMPGGVLVYEGYGPRQLEYGTGGPKQPEMLPSLEEVMADLPGLQFIHTAEADREVIEGRYHTGMANVVQVTARKG